MLSTQCSKTCTCEVLVDIQKCNYSTTVPIKVSFENYWTLNPANTHSLAIFSSIYCLFKGGYFSSVDLEMGVRIHS